MKSSSVRIDLQTRVILQSLAKSEKKTLTEILKLAVENFRRQLLFQQAREAYDKLKLKPEEWENYKTEIESMNGTMMDGLETEDAEGWY